MTAPICFIDVETTSLDPWRRRPWEIAMIRRDQHGDTPWLLMVGDVDLSDADPMSLEIGRFHERHVTLEGHRGQGDRSDAAGNLVMVRPEQTCAEVVSTITRGAHIVGAIPSFDETTLRDMLRRHRLCWTAHYHLIDVEAMAVGYLAHKAQVLRSQFPDTLFAEQQLPWKSDELSLACDVEPPTEQERHTALGDARWAMRLYDAILGGGVA